eukprot:6713478-Prymnesium_polylepis.1
MCIRDRTRTRIAAQDTDPYRCAAHALRCPALQQHPDAAPATSRAPQAQSFDAITAIIKSQKS